MENKLMMKKRKKPGKKPAMPKVKKPAMVGKKKKKEPTVEDYMKGGM